MARVFFLSLLSLLFICGKTCAQDDEKKPKKVYRVIIYQGDKKSKLSKQAAIDTKAAFEAKYPDVKAYTTYSNPYHVCEVGDYTKKSKATDMLNKLIDEYPNAGIMRYVNKGLHSVHNRDIHKEK